MCPPELEKKYVRAMVVPYFTTCERVASTALLVVVASCIVTAVRSLAVRECPLYTWLHVVQ